MAEVGIEAKKILAPPDFPVYREVVGARRSSRFSVAIQEGLENRDPFEQGPVKRRECRAPRTHNFGMHSSPLSGWFGA